MIEKRIVNMLTPDTAYGYISVSSTDAVQFGANSVETKNGVDGFIYVEGYGFDNSVTGVGIDVDLYGSYNGYQWFKRADITAFTTSSSVMYYTSAVPHFLKIGFDYNGATSLSNLRVMFEINESI